MKMIFTKPRMIGQFPSWWVGKAFKGYLAYLNVFIGTEGVDW